MEAEIFPPHIKFCEATETSQLSPLGLGDLCVSEKSTWQQGIECRATEAERDWREDRRDMLLPGGKMVPAVEWKENSRCDWQKHDFY